MAVAVARLVSPDSPRQGGVPNKIWLNGTGVDHTAHGFEIVGSISAVEGWAGDIPVLGFVLDDDC